MEQDYYGISRQEVEWLPKHCSTCTVKRSQIKTAPMKLIVVSSLFERVQIDLIDMSSTPMVTINGYDHFSKYSQAYALTSKYSQNVADVATLWVSHLGTPRILQFDNGSEFNGAPLLLLHVHGIQASNSRVSPILLID